MNDSPPIRASISEAHPVTGPERLPPEPPSNFLPWIILGAVAAAVLVMFVRRRPTKAPELSAEEWAAQQFARISSSNGDGHELGERLPQVIRGYVERRYQIAIDGKTTRESAAALRITGMNENDVAGWCNLLDRCDLAKFARQQFSPAESAETLRRAQTLLASSLPPDESSTPAKTGEFR